MAVNPLSADAGHFGRLGLAPAYRLAEADVESRFRRLQAAVHPDRFAGASAADRRLALQRAAECNEAYRVLANPTLRAAHLCELMGVPVDAERNTAMRPEFLMQQMAWRERLDELAAPVAGTTEADARSQAGLAELKAELLAEQAACRERIAHLLDDAADTARAAAQVRELMFYDKLLDELRRIARRSAR